LTSGRFVGDRGTGPDAELRNSVGLARTKAWRCRRLRFEGEGDDVPDHHHSHLKALAHALAGSLRLPKPAAQADWNLDHREAASDGDEEHVRGEVIASDQQVGKDALQRGAAD